MAAWQATSIGAITVAVWKGGGAGGEARAVFCFVGITPYGAICCWGAAIAEGARDAFACAARVSRTTLRMWWRWP